MPAVYIWGIAYLAVGFVMGLIVPSIPFVKKRLPDYRLKEIDVFWMVWLGWGIPAAVLIVFMLGFLWGGGRSGNRSIPRVPALGNTKSPKQ